MVTSVEATRAAKEISAMLYNTGNINGEYISLINIMEKIIYWEVNYYHLSIEQKQRWDRTKEEVLRKPKK